MECSWLIQSGPLLLLLPTGSPKEPPPLTLETASTTQPTSLLVTFLQYSSIVIQDTKGQILFPPSSAAAFTIRIVCGVCVCVCVCVYVCVCVCVCDRERELKLENFIL